MSPGVWGQFGSCTAVTSTVWWKRPGTADGSAGRVLRPVNNGVTVRPPRSRQHTVTTAPTRVCGGVGMGVCWRPFLCRAYICGHRLVAQSSGMAAVNPLPLAQVQEWQSQFVAPGGRAMRGYGSAGGLGVENSLYTEASVMRFISTCATWKVALEALTVALCEEYAVRFGDPKTNQGVAVPDLLPQHLVRRVVRSILAAGVVVFRATSKGIEIAEPWEHTLVYTGSSAIPRLSVQREHMDGMAAAGGRSTWRVVAWAAPIKPKSHVVVGGSRRRRVIDQAVKFSQYRSACKDALVDTAKLVMMENSFVRRSHHNSRPGAFTQVDLKTTVGSARPWFDGVTQPPNGLPELDVDHDFQLLLGNRVDTIRALDREDEKFRVSSGAVKRARETAVDDSDPITGIEVGKRGHNEHRVTDGHAPKIVAPQLLSPADAIFQQQQKRRDVLQLLLVPPQAIGEVETGERTASTAVSFHSSIERFRHNLAGIAHTINEMLEQCTAAVEGAKGDASTDHLRAFMAPRMTVRKLTLVAAVMTPEACRRELATNFGITESDLSLEAVREAQSVHVAGGNVLTFEPLVRTDRLI